MDDLMRLDGYLESDLATPRQHLSYAARRARLRVLPFEAMDAAISIGNPVEPLMHVQITVPQECVDGVLFTLMGRRADIRSEEVRNGVHIIHALVPLTEMTGYASELRVRTQGRATYSMHLDRYQPLPNTK